MMDRIARVIEASARGRQTFARIALDPPSLGHLRVQMRLRGDGLQVRVLADGEDARRVLSSQVEELRTALERQGVRVERLEFQGPGDDVRSRTGTGAEAGTGAPSLRSKGGGPADGDANSSGHEDRSHAHRFALNGAPAAEAGRMQHPLDEDGVDMQQGSTLATPKRIGPAGGIRLDVRV